jgi:hypothetical protein
LYAFPTLTLIHVLPISSFTLHHVNYFVYGTNNENHHKNFSTVTHPS